MGAAGPPARVSPGVGPGGFRFPPECRIRSSKEIRDLHARGKRERTPHLDVFSSPSPVSHSRLGVVVPKHGRRIVERNRLRRQLREIGRTELLPRLGAAGQRVDVLVRARREAYGAGFDALRTELVSMVEAQWCGGS